MSNSRRLMSRVNRVALMAAALLMWARVGQTEPSGHQGDELDLNGLEHRLEQLKRKEHSLRRTLERGQTEADRLRQRVIVRGRAYYRLSRGLPGSDLLEHAVRVERLRQGLLTDLSRLEEIKSQKKGAGRKLALLRERRAPLEVERQAAGRARDAILSRQERERAFQMAFKSSGTRSDHTAVYSAGAQMDLQDSTFESMRGQLPFPMPGRTEVERVRLAHAAGPGLILRSALGTPARAVFAGRIAYADEYAEYGRTVIMDHGDDYFTVVAGLTSIDVKVGDEVPQSARLGMAGEAKGMSKLYFEIRRKNETLSPGEWLGI